MANEISDEPAFNSWAKETLRQRYRIFQGKCKYWRILHNFGIEVPKKVKEAYDIDRQ